MLGSKLTNMACFPTVGNPRKPKHQPLRIPSSRFRSPQKTPKTTEGAPQAPCRLKGLKAADCRKVCGICSVGWCLFGHPLEDVGLVVGGLKTEASKACFVWFGWFGTSKFQNRFMF